MKKVFLSFAIVAALASCNKNDSLIEDMPLAEVDLNVTTESVITTEAQLDDVAEAMEYEVDLYTGTDEAIDAVEAEMSGVALKSGSSVQNNYRARYMWGNCPDIHIVKEEGGWPRTITLNYGEETELANGRIIAGIIEIVQTAPRRENGSMRTVTFDGFSVDTIGMDGTSVKTFLRDEYTVEIVRDLTFTLPDGTTIDRYAERKRIWTEGMDTPLNHWDDIIEITGFVTCEDSDGNSYKRVITTPLIKKGGCRFIVAGEVTLSKNGVEFGTINYGDMECDRIATMTTAKGSKEFVIGQRKRVCTKEKEEATE